MKRILTLVLVLALIATPALADNNLTVAIMGALLETLIDENGMGLFDSDRSEVYEADGKVFIVFYTNLPYRLFTADMDAAIKFVLGMWDAFNEMHSTLSTSRLVVSVLGEGMVYLLTDGDTVFDAVRVEIVYAGVSI